MVMVTWETGIHENMSMIRNFWRPEMKSAGFPVASDSIQQISGHQNCLYTEGTQLAALNSLGPQENWQKRKIPLWRHFWPPEIQTGRISGHQKFNSTNFWPPEIFIYTRGPWMCGVPWHKTEYCAVHGWCFHKTEYCVICVRCFRKTKYCVIHVWCFCKPEMDHTNHTEYCAIHVRCFRKTDKDRTNNTEYYVMGSAKGPWVWTWKWMFFAGARIS